MASYIKCLFPVFSCQGVAFTIIEGIGNIKTGYDQTQTRLAYFNRSQCGYCSPGMVMNMYSLLKSNPNMSESKIENSFDGNLRRCTGIRSILDAAKTFATETSTSCSKQVVDIEDLLKNDDKCSKTDCGTDPSKCINKEEDEDFEVDFVDIALAEISLSMTLKDGRKWYKAESLYDVLEIFGTINGTYMLVSGNTAKGVYKFPSKPDVYIDIRGVGELETLIIYDDSVMVGANTTLADAIRFFNDVAQEQPGKMGYLKILANHIKKIANTQVRNAGSLAGNLSIKHQHNDFQSDLFTILETVDATITIASQNGIADQPMSLLEYLGTHMYKKVIFSINLQAFDQSYYIKTYKITARAQNSIAYVNAGFKFKCDPNNKFKVLEKPSLVYGGISDSFVHATNTENFLTNTCLMDSPTLQQAFAILEKEVRPDDIGIPPFASPDYRKRLALVLFYRFILSLNPSGVEPKYRSGSENIIRPLSSGKQEYPKDPSVYPITKPILKVEASAQCSGEVQYVYDIPSTKKDFYAQLVLAKLGPAEIYKIDISKALIIQGVVRFLSAVDIPGKNSFVVEYPQLITEQEELFAAKKVLYAGQPVGMIIAEEQAIANEAADQVRIIYTYTSRPLLSVKQIVKMDDKERITFQGKIEPTIVNYDFEHSIKGEMEIPSQYHFTMETLSCYTVPHDNGLDVYCSTQWIQGLHEAIALTLNIDQNRVNIQVPRCGGAYGLKITRANVVGVACSLAAYLIREPVRMISTIEQTMEAVGKRYASFSQYVVKVNKVGKIRSLTVDLYEDAGSSNNDIVITNLVLPAIPSYYDSRTWKITGYNVKTDKPLNTWMRSPGTDGFAITERIMEHIAKLMKIDPWTVRSNNAVSGKYPLDEMIADLKTKADYENRCAAVNKFNEENVWKKRGISIMGMKYPISFIGNFIVMISVNRNDAKVVLVHGGIEIGQGINTKAIQTCGRELNIPYRYITVKASSNLTAPNNFLTDASVTSELIYLGVMKCCEILNERLDPVRRKLYVPRWKKLVSQAFLDNVNLNASAMMTPEDLKEYNVFGCAVTECEIDVLTGEHTIPRVDLLQDVGRSINPLIDVGQAEGAFVTGLGWQTSEELDYDSETGRLRTNRSFNYKIPGAKDIPIDFRVYLRKNSDNPLGVLGSKAIGEPPFVLSLTLPQAIRYAVQSARKDMGLPDRWITAFDAPYTAEKICFAAKATRTKFEF